MPEGGIRPYQLLDACARSPLLRERYVGLVKMSASRIAELVKQGQEQGMLRPDLEPENAGSFILALIVGLQTLADLGIPPRLDVLAPDLVKLMMRG